MRRLIFIALCVTAALATICVLAGFPWSPVGTQDFIEYWSANLPFTFGRDPYDPQLMAAVQNTIRPQPTPLMMWNPPWIFFFMRPMLSASFESAARIWFAMNIGFFIFSISVLRKVLLPQQNALTASLVSLPFVLATVNWWQPVSLSFNHVKSNRHKPLRGQDF